MARPTVRWLVVGETAHGNNEFPRAAACLIRSAMASGRAVHVALEYATRNQPWLDAYLDSDGSDAARAALLSAPLWDPECADGKSSTAMFGLIEWLRLQHRASGVAGVIAFDADEGRGTVREERMAQRLRTVDAGRDGIVVLTGSFHARKRDGGSDPTGYVPAAGRLPADRTFSLRLRGKAVGVGHAGTTVAVCTTSPRRRTQAADPDCRCPQTSTMTPYWIWAGRPPLPRRSSRLEWVSSADEARRCPGIEGSAERPKSDRRVATSSESRSGGPRSRQTSALPSST